MFAESNRSVISLRVRLAKYSLSSTSVFLLTVKSGMVMGPLHQACQAILRIELVHCLFVIGIRRLHVAFDVLHADIARLLLSERSAKLRLSLLQGGMPHQVSVQVDLF